MTKETVKSAILAGVVGGVTAAATLLISLQLYITIEEWYGDYKRNQIEKQESATHCCNPGVAEYFRQEDSLAVPNDTLDQVLYERYAYPNGREVDWTIKEVADELGALTRSKYSKVFYDPSTHAEAEWRYNNNP